MVEADLYIIAVTDVAIADVFAQLPFKNSLVVHTSGSSIPMDSLNNKNRKGIFYTLQTFTKGKEIYGRLRNDGRSTKRYYSREKCRSIEITIRGTLKK